MFEDELKYSAMHPRTHKLEHEETKGNANNRGKIEGRYPISNS
jgi:hypothetical protein